MVGSDAAARPRVRPRAIALSQEQQLRKVEAMRTYGTQFEALEAGGSAD